MNSHLTHAKGLLGNMVRRHLAGRLDAPTFTRLTAEIREHIVDAEVEIEGLTDARADPLDQLPNRTRTYGGLAIIDGGLAAVAGGPAPFGSAPGPVALPGDPQPGDRVDQGEAERLTDFALIAITRLSSLAQDAATREELRVIDRDASFLCDVLQRLTTGVVRPALSNTQTDGAA